MELSCRYGARFVRFTTLHTRDSHFVGAEVPQVTVNDWTLSYLGKKQPTHFVS